MTCEGITRNDRKAPQLATSHGLGQDFARAFDITTTPMRTALVRDRLDHLDERLELRLVGDLIADHGDRQPTPGAAADNKARTRRWRSSSSATRTGRSTPPNSSPP